MSPWDVSRLKDGAWMPISASDTFVARAVRARSIGIVFGAVWLIGVTAGLAWLAAYDNGPGVAAHAPVRWPASSHLAHDPARPTLVMIAHPRCVCTRASVGELAELMARAHEPPKAYVVFIKPAGTASTWDDTDLWHSAERIPGVTVVRDDDGLETQRFGAETSGQTLLYDAAGRLIFSGGTTGSRGHPGDNIGRASIIGLLNREEGQRPATSVFGCPLFAEHDPRRVAQAPAEGPAAGPAQGGSR
jgi:hypothetical protein